MALRAVVEGSQPISVVWLKDKGEIIRESENVKISFSDNIATLQIASAEATNGGKYICQIKNDAGMRECTGYLQVLGWYRLPCPSKESYLSCPCSLGARAIWVLVLVLQLSFVDCLPPSRTGCDSREA